MHSIVNSKMNNGYEKIYTGFLKYIYSSINVYSSRSQDKLFLPCVVFILKGFIVRSALCASHDTVPANITTSICKIIKISTHNILCITHHTPFSNIKPLTFSSCIHSFVHSLIYLNLQVLLQNLFCV